MKQKPKLNRFSRLLSTWRNPKSKNYMTHSGTREIYLYCYKNEIKIPEDVLKVFVEWVHIEVQRDRKKKLNNQKELRKSSNFDGIDPDYIIYLFVNVLNMRHIRNPKKKRIHNYEAFKRYSKLLKKSHNKDFRSSEAVKTAFYRARKLVLNGEFK